MNMTGIMSDSIVYTARDFTEKTDLYEELYSKKDDQFAYMQSYERLRLCAENVGVKKFPQLYRAYENSKAPSLSFDNKTEFSDQPLCLACGEYICDDTGVFLGEKQVCPHPIMPVRRLVNIESGEWKLTVAFRKGDKWTEYTAQRSFFASAQDLVKLADYGISVTSKNAKDLAAYISEVETYNHADIPEKQSVSRLGWIKDDLFSPYCNNIEFDDKSSYGALWDSVKENGSFEVWKDAMCKLRAEKSAGRLFLAASFASVLIKPLGALPFFLHVWGGSGNGKTVGLMVAASVWGDPAPGKYVLSFNSTAVGQEMTAAFFNNLPMCMDELQILKSKGQKEYDGIIYQLAEGAGRIRGKKDGGTQAVPTWKNCFITTGEEPLGTGSSGGGAVNRVIEIECKDKLCSDMPGLCNIIRENYGSAGRKFVEYLMTKQGLDAAKEYYKAYYEQLTKIGSTDKQAQAAALILAADTIATDIIFKDGNMLTSDDLVFYMKKAEEVDINERAYADLLDIINSKRANFGTWDVNMHYCPPTNSEFWGAIDKECCYFIPVVLKRVLEDAGYNKKAFLSWAAENGYLRHSDKRYTIQKKIEGRSAKYNCLCIAEE